MMQHTQRGQILIEAVVGISVALMGLLAVLGLLTRSIIVNRDIAHQFVAAYLAAEGIEAVKYVIDANHVLDYAWNQGLEMNRYEIETPSEREDGTVDPTTLLLELASTSIPRYLTLDENGGIYTYSSVNTTTTPYTRVVAIEQPDVSSMIVRSTVQWSSRGTIQEVNLEDHFYDWRKK